MARRQTAIVYKGTIEEHLELRGTALSIEVDEPNDRHAYCKYIDKVLIKEGRHASKIVELSRIFAEREDLKVRIDLVAAQATLTQYFYSRTFAAVSHSPHSPYSCEAFSRIEPHCILETAFTNNARLLVIVPSGHLLTGCALVMSYSDFTRLPHRTGLFDIVVMLDYFDAGCYTVKKILEKYNYTYTIVIERTETKIVYLPMPPSSAVGLAVEKLKIICKKKAGDVVVFLDGYVNVCDVVNQLCTYFKTPTACGKAQHSVSEAEDIRDAGSSCIVQGKSRIVMPVLDFIVRGLEGSTAHPELFSCSPYFANGVQVAAGRVDILLLADKEIKLLHSIPSDTPRRNIVFLTSEAGISIATDRFNIKYVVDCGASRPSREHPQSAVATYGIQKAYWRSLITGTVYRMYCRDSALGAACCSKNADDWPFYILARLFFGVQDSFSCDRSTLHLARLGLIGRCTDSESGLLPQFAITAEGCAVMELLLSTEKINDRSLLPLLDVYAFLFNAIKWGCLAEALKAAKRLFSLGRLNPWRITEGLVMLIAHKYKLPVDMNCGSWQQALVNALYFKLCSADSGCYRLLSDGRHLKVVGNTTSPYILALTIRRKRITRFVAVDENILFSSCSEYYSFTHEEAGPSVRYEQPVLLKGPRACEGTKHYRASADMHDISDPGLEQLFEADNE